MAVSKRAYAYIEVPVREYDDLKAEVERLRYVRQFLDDLAHLRCEDDCEGFRDPCAACVVHEARRRLGDV